jgi:hypothetical protein
MKPAVLAIAFVVLSSCGRDIDSYTDANMYWINSTSHVIEIRPYAFGAVIQNYVVILQPGQGKQVGSERSMGKHNIGMGCASEYLLASDSIQVIFDGQYSISHYFQQPAIVSPKFYTYQSLRNLGNILGYEMKVEKESKYSASHSYIFRFSEQDYLDAK